MKELEYLSATEIGSMVNRKEISPTEVLKYFEERIKVRNPSINAFVYTNFEDAYKEAKSMEERLAKGEDCGVFAGVPVGLKDFLPSKKGWTNTHGGVKALTRIDEADSEFYKAARKLGAIAIGKTNAPAFAFRGLTDNYLYGATSTPFKVGYNSGGSSGGTAAAVADGLIPLGEGSDGGGSIRIPAAMCGCFGYKASVGSIPSVCRPDGWTATHPYCFNGAITRNVEDAAHIYQEMIHYDPRDPLSLPIQHNLLAALHYLGDLRGIKIALTYDFNLFKDVDPKIVDAVKKSAEALKDIGAIVEEVNFNFGKYDLKTLADLWCKAISIDTALDMHFWKEEGLDLLKDYRDQLPDPFVYWNEKAFNLNVLDVRAFNDARTAILDAHEDIFEKYDIIIAPTTTCLGVKNSEKKGETLGSSENGTIGFCETFLENFTGNPAASIPVGIADGFPIGMQIIGKKFRDEDVFRVAKMLENVQPWNYDIPKSRKV